MMHRLKAGYHVDRVAHNEVLSARFLTCNSQYSFRGNKRTLLMQGTKVCWQFLNKLAESATYESDLVVDRSQRPSLSSVIQEVRDGGLMSVLFPKEGQSAQQPF